MEFSSSRFSETNVAAHPAVRETESSLSSAIHPHFEVPDTPQQKSLLNTVFRSMKRTHDLFFHDYTSLLEIDSNA